MTTARIVSGPLDDHRLEDGRRVLDQDLVVALGVCLRGLRDVEGVREGWTEDVYETFIRVPAGFDTDYSSVPAFARAFLGRWDRHDVAGVVHDYLYRMQAPRGPADRAWQIIARSGERHVSPWQGFLGWAGLRIGGWVAYRRLASA